MREVDHSRPVLIDFLEERVSEHAQQLPIGVLSPRHIHPELCAVCNVVELREQTEQPAILTLFGELGGECVGVPLRLCHVGHHAAGAQHHRVVDGGGWVGEEEQQQLVHLG